MREVCGSLYAQKNTYCSSPFSCAIQIVLQQALKWCKIFRKFNKSGYSQDRRIAAAAILTCTNVRIFEWRRA